MRICRGDFLSFACTKLLGPELNELCVWNNYYWQLDMHRESATVFSATLPDKDSGLALSSDSAAARNEFTRWRGVAVERAVLW